MKKRRRFSMPESERNLHLARNNHHHSDKKDFGILLVSIPSETRIMGIESDVKEIRERVAVLEEQQRQRSHKGERWFNVKIALFVFALSLAASILTYIVMGSLPY